ncbi:hypothetical protein BC629DRAFT_1289949 [Irpex lacteus]|nr:hypothetical protein BC629DRAFT_1289949 [Irpex lacteus]
MNEAIRVAGEVQTNQTGELTAILQALKKTPNVVPLKIISDSKFCIEGIVLHSPAWEAKGWFKVEHRDLFKAIVSWARSRAATTTFQWIKGHSGDEGNEKADRLAAEGAALPLPQSRDLGTKQQFLPGGAQLSALTQADIYRGLRQRKSTPKRRGTTKMLDLTRNAVEDVTGDRPWDKTIWKAIRHKDTSRKIQNFMWRVMHDSLICGERWANIEGYEYRGICKTCEVEENIDHILTKCRAPGQETIWNQVSAALGKKVGNTPPITLGTITGANLLKITYETDEEETVATGKTRLFRIMVAESAHLIWKIRCERVIEHEDDPSKWPSQAHIVARWRRALNERLSIDRRLTTKKIPEKHRLEKDLVLKTWSGILENETRLPEDWVNWTGVLVGRFDTERVHDNRAIALGREYRDEG